MTRTDAPAPLAALPPAAAFRARPPWWGGDLQTLRNRLVGVQVDLTPWPVERLVVSAGDGSGDRLVAELQRPHAGSDGSARKPLALVLHGLGGCSDSPSVRVTARQLLAAGYPVLRLNMRGSGPSRPLCRYSYNAGLTGDLAATLNALPGDLAGAGVVAVGYSLGGAVLANFLGEGRARHGSAIDRVSAGLTVSAPLDLLAAARQVEKPRNRPYHRYLMNRLKADMLATPELSPALARAIRAARTLPGFDDTVTAPLAGFRDGMDYYRRCSPLRRLASAARPLAVLHARNDTWIPAGSLAPERWADRPGLAFHLTRSGGHCGFHAPTAPTPWQDRLALALLAAVAGAGSPAGEEFGGVDGPVAENGVGAGALETQ